MNYSTHYNLNLAEGTDLVNPLTVDVPNYTAIDTAMFANEQAGVGTATELKSGSIHALTRANQNRDVFKFHSTSIYNTGDTFTVDGSTVTALAVDGSSLKDRCFIIGSDVLCILNGSQLTVLAIYVPETINASSVYQEESNPSTHNYTIGERFIMNGVTYKAKTAISIGDSLVLGTNIEAETLGTRMNGINQDISDRARGEWIFVDSKTDTTSITVPSGFRELMVFVHQTGDYSLSYSFNICKEELSNTARTFRQGYYISSTNNGCAYINATTSSVALGNFLINGTSYTSNTTTELYYR